VEYNIVDDDTFFDTTLFFHTTLFFLDANSQFIVNPVNHNGERISEAHSPNAPTFGLGSGYNNSGRSSD